MTRFSTQIFDLHKLCWLVPPSSRYGEEGPANISGGGSPIKIQTFDYNVTNVRDGTTGGALA